MKKTFLYKQIAGIISGQIRSPTGRYKNYVRLNYALVSEDEIDYAMKVMAGLIAGQ